MQPVKLMSAGGAGVLGGAWSPSLSVDIIITIVPGFLLVEFQ